MSWHQKTAWLAVFYMCIPTGIAIGYVYGGLVSFSYDVNILFVIIMSKCGLIFFYLINFVLMLYSLLCSVIDLIVPFLAFL